jgi:hypothetical protein
MKLLCVIDAEVNEYGPENCEGVIICICSSYYIPLYA